MGNKKVWVELRDDGNLYDDYGIMMVSASAFTLTDAGERKGATIDDIVKLKEAGFDSAEIIEMNKKGLI